jgi:hypothetical protein
VPVNGFGDAFGGSLLLGLATTLLCAFAFAMSIYHFARWMISHRDSIATIIETLLRTVEDHARPSEFDLARQLVTPRRRRPLTALQLSKRGPPEMLAT